jgi:glycosyltransferase involved in cell wall biosynthesis
MTADTVGGVWTYALELADALAPHGVEVVLATMGRPLSHDQREAVRRSTVLDVRESAFALEWMDDPWAEVDAAGDWLLDLDRELQPDVVHLNGYVHATLPFSSSPVVVGHSCVASWWDAVRREPAPASWSTYRERVAAGLAAAGAVVAPTQAMLDALVRHYGVADGTVVPNARDPRFVRTGVAKEPLILSAGRVWDDAKNVRALVATAPRLDWPVAIAGEGDVQVALPVAGSGSGGGRGSHECHVNALGRLPFDELAGWLARASIFALPARYEPFGLAALEAGLSGCALVLGDIPSLREVWGDAAVFVDPFDDDHLGAVLQDLVAGPSRVAELGRRAADRARTYTPERMAQGYLDVYERLPVGGRP